MKAAHEAGLAGHIRAQRKLQRLRRYGSHRVKVVVRRAGHLAPKEALQAVRAELGG